MEDTSKVSPPSGAIFNAPIEAWQALSEFVSSNKDRNNRAVVLAKHLLAHGKATTKQLQELYGYTHPPRVRASLQEYGFSIGTKLSGAGSDKVCTYGLVGLAESKPRAVVPKRVKKQLIARDGACCAYHGPEPEKGLQVEHKIPYQVDSTMEGNFALERFHLACASANMAKKQACQTCTNSSDRCIDVCTTCYWANPSAFTHVATVQERRVALRFTGSSTSVYDKADAAAAACGLTVQEWISRLISKETDSPESR